MESSNTVYLDQSSVDNPPFNIDANDFALAGQLVDLHNETTKISNISRVVQIEFYNFMKPMKGDPYYEQVPATNCTEFYADQLAEHQGLQKEFNDDNWKCPDIDTITLRNQPKLFPYGQNINLVVNYCQSVEKNPDEDCESLEFSKEYIETVELQFKFVTQFFSPQTYLENGKMCYTGILRVIQALNPGATRTYETLIKKNSIEFYTSKFFDWAQTNLNIGSTYLTTYISEYTGTCQLYPGSDLIRTSGIYKVELNQGLKEFEFTVQLLTFDQMLALIGGFIGFLQVLLQFSTSDYQDFQYKSQKIRNLYFVNQAASVRQPTNLSTDDYDLKKEITHRLRLREVYKMDYWSFWKKTLKQQICCNRYQDLQLTLRDKALKRIDSETDLYDIINQLRVTKLVNQLMITEPQSKLVPYFQKFYVDQTSITDNDPSEITASKDSHIDQNDSQEESCQRPVENLFELLEDFNPEVNKIDQLILNEILQQQPDQQPLTNVVLDINS